MLSGFDFSDGFSLLSRLWNREAMPLGPSDLDISGKAITSLNFSSCNEFDF